VNLYVWLISACKFFVKTDCVCASIASLKIINDCAALANSLKKWRCFPNLYRFRFRTDSDSVQIPIPYWFQILGTPFSYPRNQHRWILSWSVSPIWSSAPRVTVNQEMHLHARKCTGNSNLHLHFWISAWSRNKIHLSGFFYLLELSL
jgi:hypothetical protein